MSVMKSVQFDTANHGGIKNLGGMLHYRVVFQDPTSGELVLYIHSDVKVSVKAHLERIGADFESAIVESFRA